MPAMMETGKKGVTKEQVEEIVKTSQKEMLETLKKDDEFIMKIASGVSKLLEMSKKNEPAMEYLDEQKNNFYRDPNIT